MRRRYAISCFLNDVVDDRSDLGIFCFDLRAKIANRQIKIVAVATVNATNVTRIATITLEGTAGA